MPSTLTVSAIQEETRRALGNSGVEVELDDKDIIKALKDAVRVYNHNRPRHSRATVAVTPGVKRYVITHPGLQGVVNVAFVEPQAIAEQKVDPFDPMTFRSGNPAVPQPYGDRELSLGYIEYARNVSSSETEWHGQWEGEVYALYLDVYRAGMLCGYEYIWHVIPTDDAALGLRHIDGSDEDWIMEYVLAKSKTVLSRIRGKFAGITNPDGASDQVDYQELANEGREDLTKLDEAIKKRRRPMFPVAG